MTAHHGCNETEALEHARRVNDDTIAMFLAAQEQSQILSARLSLQVSDREGIARISTGRGAIIRGVQDLHPERARYASENAFASDRPSYVDDRGLGQVYSLHSPLRRHHTPAARTGTERVPKTPSPR